MHRGFKWICCCVRLLGNKPQLGGAGPPRSALAISIKASRSQIDPSGFQVPRPFGPAWGAAWVGCLRGHGHPAQNQSGVWRGGAGRAHPGSGGTPLYCGQLGSCGVGPAWNPHPPRSSTPSYRPGGLSLRTVLARSAWPEAAGWAPWSPPPGRSRCCCHLPGGKRKTVWAGILGRRWYKQLAWHLLGPPWGSGGHAEKPEDSPWLHLSPGPVHMLCEHLCPQVCSLTNSKELLMYQLLYWALSNALTYGILMITRFTDEVTKVQEMLVRVEWVCVCTKSCPTLCDPMDIARQAPLSVGFSRQEYWSGLPFPSPGDLPNPGIEPVSPASPALAGGFFTTGPPAGCQTDHVAAVARPLAPFKRSQTAQLSVWHTGDRSIISCYYADSCPGLLSHVQVYFLYIFIKWSKHQYGLKST